MDLGHADSAKVKGDPAVPGGESWRDIGDIVTRNTLVRHPGVHLYLTNCWRRVIFHVVFSQGSMIHVGSTVCGDKQTLTSRTSDRQGCLNLAVFCWQHVNI